MQELYYSICQRLIRGVVACVDPLAEAGSLCGACLLPFGGPALRDTLNRFPSGIAWPFSSVNIDPGGLHLSSGPDKDTIAIVY